MLDDNHPIFEACKTGDIAVVESYLKDGGSVYAESEHNPPIFGIAANREHKDLLELMLQYGLDINMRHNRFGGSLAEFAIHKDSVEWLDYFIQKGIPIDVRDNHGFTLLLLAAAGGKTKCLTYLLERGASLEARNESSGKTPFMHAASSNQIQALEILLHAGSHIEDRDYNNATSLINAAKGGKVEAVQWLLDHGADINAKDERGKTASDWATINGHTEIVKLLNKRHGNCGIG